MRTLKYIIIILLVIIAIPLLVALFVPREFHNSGSIVVNRPKSEVFNYIKLVKNQDKFGIWQLSDTSMTTQEEGVDGTVGFRYTWDSNELGRGAQVITKVTENERMESDLYFLNFSEQANQSYLSVADTLNGQTCVKWGMTGSTPYPWNLMHVLYNMDQDFDKGLENLKGILESSPKRDEISSLRAYYNETLNKLKTAINGLSDEQVNFKNSDQEWSIIQCIEHIAIAQPQLFNWLKEGLEKPENPTDRKEINIQDDDIKQMITDRSSKIQAPPSMTPTGRYTDTASALQEFSACQEEILAFLSRYSLEELRNHVFALPTGKADAYQFALFIAAHTERHILQIDEIKRQVAFPKK